MQEVCDVILVRQISYYNDSCDISIINSGKAELEFNLMPHKTILKSYGELFAEYVCICVVYI